MRFGPISVVAGAVAVCLVGVGGLGAGLFSRSASNKPDFARHIQPLLTNYCYRCHNDDRHKGGLSLEAYTNTAAIFQHRDLWVELMRKVNSREMPPADKAQPNDQERGRIVSFLQDTLFPVDCQNPDPGRVTIRRLNRAEYNNTIRDLLGVDFHPADDFPNDDTGYGFDNIGDVLTLSPLLLERYLAAAETIMDRVFSDHDSKARLLGPAVGAADTNAALEAVVGRFATRAYRRPLDPPEQARLSGFARDLLAKGGTFDHAVKLSCQAVLVSPLFLFRGEVQPQPKNPARICPVDDFALASRLSYFLWSSMPDEELFGLAAKGRLRGELTEQVRRMLKNPKADALITNFTGQWLQLRNLKTAAPDRGMFPEFDEDLRAAMATETKLFCEHIVREDRSVMEFLSADYTFANERLARFYGLKEKVSGFQKVSLKGSGRAGILTHASILTLTSNPTRTSPVKRGKWVLENLLAQAPPPPPANIPPLNESKAAAATASLRERMQEHREDPMCASCHAQMDPIGFSLENFDGIGAWRAKDGAFTIDASGKLPGGAEFSGADGLRALLVAQRKQEFLKCLTEKMLTYALGRGLEFYDRCAVERIVAGLQKRDCRFSALIEAVAQSVPFQQRRGDGRAGR